EHAGSDRAAGLDDRRERRESLVEGRMLDTEGSDLVDEGGVVGADLSESEALLGLVLAGAGLDEQTSDVGGTDLVQLVDDPEGSGDVVEAERQVEPLGDLAVVDLDAEVPDRKPPERLRDDERHLGLEVRGELTEVDDVDVGLGELPE